MLTLKQKLFYEYIYKAIIVDKRSLTYYDIADETKMKYWTVRDYIRILRKKGYIKEPINKHGGDRYKLMTEKKECFLKTCYKCKQEKPTEDFYEDKRRYDGYMSSCKKCNSTNRSHTARKTYRKHTIKWHARSKLYYAVKKGIIKKTDCISIYSDPCRGEIEAHHFLGYEGEHWKDVMWLCEHHHRKTHLVKEVLTYTPSIGNGERR